ncbi:MAG: response regulator [Moorea sp. SIO4G2]|nr:response regulator [Moorena sp. SIO4G2]
MPEGSVKILLIEDNLAEARLLQEFLKEAQFRQFSLVHVKRLRDALQEIAQARAMSIPYDVILLDLTLPDSHGLASLGPLIKQAPSLPIVVLTNTNDDELAIEAVRQGAQDYLVKRQVKGKMLVRSLRYAIERKQAAVALRQENQALESQVQEQTAELVRAKEVNQRKAEFVSMLSHDFRNPLNTILLCSGLLQDKEEQLPKEKKLVHLRLIRSAIKNMAELLDEVSLISKADSGKLLCQPTRLDLKRFCHQLVEELQISTNNNHQLVFTSQGELREALWDERLLRHIFSNLLTNAIKYSPTGGTVQFELIAQTECVIFRIQDQGMGIPPEDQPQLFEPFHRASNVGTIPGSGLGLAIVKQCVEAHGGEISLKSQLGEGTTFTVSLPLIMVKL